MGLVAVVVAVVCMGFPLVCVLVGLAACGSCGPTLAWVWASKKHAQTVKSSAGQKIDQTPYLVCGMDSNHYR
jgi:hypothetical protein